MNYNYFEKIEHEVKFRFLDIFFHGPIKIWRTNNWIHYDAILY